MKVVITILKKDQVERIARLAQIRECSKSMVIRQIIDDWFSQILKVTT